MSVVKLSEDQVKQLLNWPLVCEAVEQSLRSICEERVSEEQPTSNQPTRNITVPPNGGGILFTMPGFIGNYKLPKTGRGQTVNTKVFNSLGCKLVTSFPGNMNLKPPKPNIMGNIFLFNEHTGELEAIIQGTEITAWRTAAASLVATNYLFLRRPMEKEPNRRNKVVAIVGCGVQGRIHAIGLCSLYSFASIYLWNRTKKRAVDLAAELNGLRHQFKNAQMDIVTSDSVIDCVKNADIIVTATFASQPVVTRSMLKDNVHINAVGAGQSHHSELGTDVYRDPQTQIYIDNWGSARTELKTLDAPIVGEVGDIINRAKPVPFSGITVFQSMGMAVEDVAVGQAVLEKYQNNV